MANGDTDNGVNTTATSTTFNISTNATIADSSSAAAASRHASHNPHILNGTLTLQGGRKHGGIDDTEAFATAIIKRARLNLTPHDHEDLLAYLVEETWILSRTYRPGTKSFSTLAGERLPLRIIDWQRQRHGRTRWQFSHTTYERTHPELTTLDHPLAHTHTTRTLDDPAHRDPDLPRLLRNRDRTNDRPYPTLDRRTTRTAA